MRFDIYGRFKIDVESVNNSWIVYRVEDGKRRPDPNIVIPATITEHCMVEYLDDLLNEFARPEKSNSKIMTNWATNTVPGAFLSFMGRLQKNG